MLFITGGTYCAGGFTNGLLFPACSFCDVIYSRVGVRGAIIATNGFGAGRRRSRAPLRGNDLAQSDLRSRQYHFNRAATSTSHVKKDGGLVAAGTESLVAMVTEITATSW